MRWLLGISCGLILGGAACSIYLSKVLGRVRSYAENWRNRFQTEQLDRARFESQAARVGPLESDVREGRERMEALQGEKSRLESIAERVPALEERVTSLNDELMSLKSTNAELQTHVREQVQAHLDKVAAL